MANKLQEKKCEICGSSFKPNSWNQRFCKRKHDSVCRVCGISVKDVYNIKIIEDRVFCSNDCLQKKIQATNLEKYGVTSPAKNPEVLAKMKQTNLKKYGSESPLGNAGVQEKIKQTNLERYGSEYIGGSESVRKKIAQTNLERYGSENVFGSEEIRERSKVTIQERYGVDNYGETKEHKIKSLNTMIDKYGAHYSQTEEFKERSKKTNLEKYGVEFYTQSQEYHDKVKRSNFEKYGVEYLTSLESFHETSRNIKIKKREEFKSRGYLWIKDIINEYGQGILKLDIPRVRYNSEVFISEKYLDIIKNYEKSNQSVFEAEIYEYIKTISENEVIRNDRSVINPYELDIYIPSFDLAIECNGIYWHSLEAGTPKDYHFMKSERCNAEGVRLIHINQWSWDNNRKFIKKILRSLLQSDTLKRGTLQCYKHTELNKDLLRFIEDNSVYKVVNINTEYDEFYEVAHNSKTISLYRVSHSHGRVLMNVWHDYSYSLQLSLSHLLKQISSDCLEVYVLLDRDFADAFLLNVDSDNWGIHLKMPPESRFFYDNSVCFDDSKLEDERVLELLNSGMLIVKYKIKK